VELEVRIECIHWSSMVIDWKLEIHWSHSNEWR